MFHKSLFTNIRECYIFLPKGMYFNENGNMTYIMMTTCITFSVIHILRQSMGAVNTVPIPAHTSVTRVDLHEYQEHLVSSLRFDFGGRKCMVTSIHSKLFQQAMPLILPPRPCVEISF
jgi:hypothetical protein